MWRTDRGLAWEGTLWQPSPASCGFWLVWGLGAWCWGRDWDRGCWEGMGYSLLCLTGIKCRAAGHPRWTAHQSARQRSTGIIVQEDLSPSPLHGLLSYLSLELPPPPGSQGTTQMTPAGGIQPISLLCLQDCNSLGLCPSPWNVPHHLAV